MITMMRNQVRSSRVWRRSQIFRFCEWLIPNKDFKYGRSPADYVNPQRLATATHSLPILIRFFSTTTEPRPQLSPDLIKIMEQRLFSIENRTSYLQRVLNQAIPCLDSFLYPCLSIFIVLLVGMSPCNSILFLVC